MSRDKKDGLRFTTNLFRGQGFETSQSMHGTAALYTPDVSKHVFSLAFTEP